MRFLKFFSNDDASRREQLQQLYRSAERGGPLPDIRPDVRNEFDSHQDLIGRISELASSVGPPDASAQRAALLSRVAEQRSGDRVAEGAPIFGRLFRNRTLAAAGVTALVVAVLATAGASGSANHVTDSVNDILGVLQIRDGSPDAAGEPQDGQPDALGLQAIIEVCHVPPGNPDGAHTISIAEAALDAHLAHGDTEGACAGDGTPAPTPAGGTVTPTPTGDLSAPALVEVCHVPPGNPDNAHTITISERALDAHLAHGDTEGACAGDGTPAPTPTDELGPAGAVEVCHVPQGNPANARTISVSDSALDAHLAHGDTEGACDGGAPTQATATVTATPTATPTPTETPVP